MKREELREGSPDVTDEALDILEDSIGVLPADYRAFLKNGVNVREDLGIFLYSIEDIVERNATFEVAEYAPGYVAVGDDGGGRAIMLRRLDSEIYLVDQGSMDPEDMVRIGTTFQSWLDAGAKLQVK